MKPERLDRAAEGVDELVRDLAPRDRVLPAGAPPLLGGTFPEAAAFILDFSPFKFALCTRRGAKTYSVGIDFILDGWAHPYAKYIFLSLTREAARNQFWEDVLKDLDRKYNLGLVFNESRLVATLPNGARIHLVGADANEKEQRKLLGGKNRKVCVDEAQDWKIDLRTFVNGTLGPSVADQGGQIILVGTPGNMVGGYFHDITKNSKAGHLAPPEEREPGWAGYSWTTFANTCVVDGVRMCDRWREKIDSLKASNPRVVETPWFRQMYLGEWVIDLDARCYRYDPDRNTFDGVLPTFPGGQWRFVLGVDLGYSPDPSAFVLFAYHDYDPTLYAIHSWKQWRMDITDVAQRINWYKAKVASEKATEIEAYVIDGANKQAVEEMRRRHNLDLLDADKRGKADFIDLMNSEFILGKIKIDTDRCCDGVIDSKVDRPHEKLGLGDEYAGLIWDPKTLPGHPQWHQGKERKELSSCPNHLTDAALYAWRHTYTYLAKAPEKRPEVGTPEWFKQEQERMRQHDEDDVMNRLEEGREPMGDSSNWDPMLR